MDSDKVTISVEKREIGGYKIAAFSVECQGNLSNPKDFEDRLFDMLERITIRAQAYNEISKEEL